MKTYVIYDNISLNSSQNDMFETKVAEKIKIRILCSTIFFFENHALYEITWKNRVQADRSHTTI